MANAFAIGKIKNLMDHGDDGACLQLAAQDAKEPDLLLSFPLDMVRDLIVTLGTATYYGDRAAQDRRTYRPFPVHAILVHAEETTGSLSITIQVEGGAFLRFPMPPAIARETAALLLQEAQKVEPAGLQ